MTIDHLGKPGSLAHHSATARTGATAAESGGAAQVNIEFEATLLQTMIKPMFPMGQSSFGRGVAGEFARSQMCQELARTLAEGGTLGIARMLDEAVIKDDR